MKDNETTKLGLSYLNITQEFGESAFKLVDVAFLNALRKIDSEIVLDHKINDKESYFQYHYINPDETENGIIDQIDLSVDVKFDDIRISAITTKLILEVLMREFKNEMKRLIEEDNKKVVSVEIVEIDKLPIKHRFNLISTHYAENSDFYNTILFAIVVALLIWWI